MRNSREWSWTFTASPSGGTRRRIQWMRVVILAVGASTVLLLAGFAFAATQEPPAPPVPQTVDTDPVPQPPPVNELGLVVVDEFGTTLQPEEPYRAPTPGPAIAPGPEGNWQIVLYNSRLIVLEGTQTGQWSRGVTHKRA